MTPPSAALRGADERREIRVPRRGRPEYGWGCDSMKAGQQDGHLPRNLVERMRLQTPQTPYPTLWSQSRSKSPLQKPTKMTVAMTFHRIEHATHTVTKQNGTTLAMQDNMTRVLHTVLVVAGPTNILWVLLHGVVYPFG